MKKLQELPRFKISVVPMQWHFHKPVYFYIDSPTNFVYQIILPLFKLSSVLPLNLFYFKTICLIVHNVFNNGTPPKVSNLFTHFSKIHHHKTRFSVAGNSYLKQLRTDHNMKNWCKDMEQIWNIVPDSDHALPKYIFKNTLPSWLLDILC